MTELELARRRIDYELTKNLGGVVGLPLRRDFERLVREDERQKHDCEAGALLPQVRAEEKP